MDERTVLTMLRAIMICMVDRSEHVQTENGAPPEKFIRLEDAVHILEDFMEDIKKQVGYGHELERRRGNHGK